MDNYLGSGVGSRSNPHRSWVGGNRYNIIGSICQTLNMNLFKFWFLEFLNLLKYHTSNSNILHYLNSGISQYKLQKKKKPPIYVLYIN